MNQSTEYDAVLGRTPQVTAAVLGGIEGAKQRYYKANTVSERLTAIQEIARYDPDEAKKYSAVVLKINVDATARNRMQEAIATIVKSFAAIATSPEIQTAVRQIGNQVQEMQVNFGQAALEVFRKEDVRKRIKDTWLEIERQEKADKELERRHLAKFQSPAYLAGVKKIVGKK